HTPFTVHIGTAHAVQHKRSQTIEAFRAANPQRFTGRPVLPGLPEAAWINEPSESGTAEQHAPDLRKSAYRSLLRVRLALTHSAPVHGPRRGGVRPRDGSATPGSRERPSRTGALGAGCRPAGSRPCPAPATGRTKTRR